MSTGYKLLPRENARLAYEHKVPEYLPFWSTDINLFQANPGIERYTGGEVGTDGFGVEWQYVPEAGAPMTTQRHLISSICDWEQIRFPDLDAIDWKKQADIDAHTDIRKMFSGQGIQPFDDGHSVFENHNRFNMCLVINGPFERMHALEGFENALCDLLEEPEACADYFKAIADWKIKYFHKIAENYPVDGINAQDDYGSAHNLFMSMETWRKLIKPNIARMVEQVHKDGLIYQAHSCGYIEPLIEDFIEIGVDAVDTWQGGSNPNVGELKKKYGDKITFVGGFDNQYVLEQPGVTIDQVITEYWRVVNLLAPGGSYVCKVNLKPGWANEIVEEHLSRGVYFYDKENVAGMR